MDGRTDGQTDRQTGCEPISNSPAKFVKFRTTPIPNWFWRIFDIPFRTLQVYSADPYFRLMMTPSTLIDSTRWIPETAGGVSPELICFAVTQRQSRQILSCSKTSYFHATIFNLSNFNSTRLAIGSWMMRYVSSVYLFITLPEVIECRSEAVKT